LLLDQGDIYGNCKKTGREEGRSSKESGTCEKSRSRKEGRCGQETCC
jgi:hypothetical protein